MNTKNYRHFCDLPDHYWRSTFGTKKSNFRSIVKGLKNRRRTPQTGPRLVMPTNLEEIGEVVLTFLHLCAHRGHINNTVVLFEVSKDEVLSRVGKAIGWLNWIYPMDVCILSELNP